MKQKKSTGSRNFISLLTAAAALVFLLLSPGTIAQGIYKNVYTIRAQQAAQQYRGQLSLWHIVSFRTGGKSGVSLLKERIARFEKKHPYVFITLTALTYEQAQERWKAGERADLYSYPLGFFGESADFLPLSEAEEPAAPFSACAHSDGRTYAYPYMADGYALVAKGSAFAAAGLDLPMDEQFSLPLLHRAASSLTPADTAQPVLGLCDTPGLLPQVALRYALFSAEDPFIGSQPPPDTDIFAHTATCSSEQFLTGDTPMLVTSCAEYQRLLADERSASMDLRAYFLSSYTDMVQLVAAGATDDPAKAACAAEFCQGMLASSAQQAVEELLLLPTTRVDDAFSAAMLQQQAYLELHQKAEIPSGFRLAANRQAAAAEASKNAAALPRLLGLSRPPQTDFSSPTSG